MRRIILCSSAALICLTSVLPAAAVTQNVSAPTARAKGFDPWDARRVQFLDLLKEHGAPQRMLEFLTSDQSVETDTFVWPIPTSDLDGDGRDDVLELHITFSISFEETQNPLDVSEDAETILKVRSGADGKMLWKERWDDFIFPIAMPLGTDGKPGVLAVGGWYPFFSVTVQEVPFTFDARRGSNGRPVWRREYRATHAGDYQTSIDENVPVSIDFFQGTEGRSTDVLLGLGTVTRVLFDELIVATRTVVIDGRDGAENVHPLIDVGVSWIPYPKAVGDLDADGFEDYVVTNSIGVDLGDGQESPSTGGTLYARRSTDGSAIWTASGMTFYEFAYPGGLADVTGGGRPEVVLVTPKDELWTRFIVYLFDGDTGNLLWVRNGEEVWSPGDVDGDGRPDVAIGESDGDAEGLETQYTRWTLTGENRTIWKRRIRWSVDGLPCPRGACLFSYFSYSMSVGDVQPDATREHLTHMYLWQDPHIEETRSYLLDAETGRTILRGGIELRPADGSIDAHGADLISVEVDEGGVHLGALDGRDGSSLWRLGFQVPGDLLPRQIYAYGSGIDTTRDRCSDLLMEINPRGGTYYAILDGGNAKVIWSKWFGPKGKAPRPLSRVDSNPAC